MARSKFEEVLQKKLKNCDYEPTKVKYKWEAAYIPDFVPRSDPNILIEVKGRFRTSNEARKYVAVIESNPDKQIVFIFMRPDLPMPSAQRRKDGTKRTHAEWAESHGFLWYTIDTIPKEWCNNESKF